MSNNNPKKPNTKNVAETAITESKVPPLRAATGVAPVAVPKPVVPPLFRKIDWISFGLTTLLVFIGDLLTLAPYLTLEDCGALAVGSFYAGFCHPPGVRFCTL